MRTLFKKVYFCAFIIALLSTTQSLKAQTAFDKGIQSPTAASLGEYANEPISLYVGKMSKSVPIHSLVAGNYTLSVGLSYNYNGFKAEAIPSPAGMGWSLNAGGVITRTVQSIKDEEPSKGYLDEYANFQSIDVYDIIEIEDGDLDAKPDMFYINAGGLSGRFYLDKFGDFQVDSQRDLKIVWDYPTTDNSRFTITDIDGTIYKFGVSQMYEKVQTKTEVIATEGGTPVPTFSDPYISAWYLTSIETTDGHIISFNYTTESYSETNLTTPAFNKRKIYTEEVRPTNSSAMFSQIQSSDRRLKTAWLDDITFNGITIDINYTSRTDFSTEKAITSIEVEDGPTVIKKFVLDTDYIGTSGGNSRLLLDKIDVYGLNDAQMPGWDFEYEQESISTALPAITSLAVDHWGYYNGQTGNSSPTNRGLPEIYNYNSGTGVTTRIPGMNLEPDPTYSDIGLLKKITLPTGGEVSYTYEPNTYWKIGSQSTSLYDYDIITFSADYTPSTSSDPYTYPTTFTVSESGGMYFELSTTGFTNDDSNVTGCPIPDPLNNYGMARFKEQSEPLSAATIVTIGSDCDIQLDQGTYEVIFDSYDSNYQGTMTLDITGIKRTLVSEKEGPGHRVKQSKVHDGVDTANDQITDYVYNESGVEATNSSGVLVSDIKTHSFHMFTLDGTYQGITVRSSSSIMPLGSTQGEALGYAKVNEIKKVGTTKLYTLNEFSNPATFPDIAGTANYGLFQPTSHDYARGKLTKQKIHRTLTNGTKEVLVESSTTYHNVDTDGTAGTGSVTDDISPRVELRRLTTVYGLEYNPSEIEYNLPVWSRTAVTTKKVFEGVLGQSVDNTTSYTYNTVNQLPETITETNSNGDTRKTTNRYAYQEESDMQTKNMLVQPYSTLLEDGSGTDISKTWTQWTNDLPTTNASPWRVWKQWSWEGTGTAPQDPSTSTAIPNSEILSYDSHGNATQLKDALGDITKVYYGSNASPFSQVGNTGTSGEYLLTGVQKVIGTDNCNNCGTRPGSGDDLYTEAEYDSYGRITKIIDENNQTNTFNYDGFGRLRESFNTNGYMLSAKEYGYSSDRNSGVFTATDPNQVISKTYVNPIFTTDFSTSTGWSGVSSVYNLFNVQKAGETTVQMGSGCGSCWEGMNTVTLGEDAIVRVDFYPDATTGGTPHFILNSSANRFGVHYLPSSDSFRIQYKKSPNTFFTYPFTFPLDAPIDTWYTIEIQKIGSELTAWVYPRGQGRDPDNSYTLGGFDSSWDPNFTLSGNDSYYYAANLSISEGLQSTVSYVDGLGRNIQNQNRGGNIVIATETLYDERGLPEVTSRPIEETAANYPGFYDQGLMRGGGTFSPGGVIDEDAPVHAYYAPILNVANDEDYAYNQTEYEHSPLARVEKASLPGISFKMGSGNELITTYGLNSSETFSTSAQGSVPAKTWGTYTLHKTINEDPEGNKTITYTDGWGQTIASGVDMDGNNLLSRTTGGDLVTEFVYDLRGNLVRVEDPRGLATTYTYNTLGQLTEKKLPDQTHPHKYRYDDKGRLRFHRDPVQDAASDHYYYTKYDDLDRPTDIGKRNTSADFDDYTDINNASFPTSSYTLYVRRSYDGTNAASGAQNLEGRMSRIQYRDLVNTSQWGYTWYSYNDLGLVEWVIQRMPGQSSSLDKKIEYSYDELGRMTRLFFNPSGTTDDHYFWYYYDELGRLEKVTSYGSNSESSALTEAEYTYYADGQVEQLKLGGGAQTIDYEYTAQGWMEEINNGTTTGGDVFGMSLTYENNGNISHQQWEQAAFSTSTYNYYYEYDNANRLKKACYGAITCTSSGDFDVTYSYDKNGNITYISRNASGSDPDIEYYLSYVANTNKIDDVLVDGVSSATETYSHDASGNVTENGVQGISSTAYDWRNLPTSLTANGSTITYIYDADGNRVKKQVGSTTTWYIRGADGQTIAAYDGSNNLIFLNILAGGQIIGQIEN